MRLDFHSYSTLTTVMNSLQKLYFAYLSRVPSLIVSMVASELHPTKELQYSSDDSSDTHKIDNNSDDEDIFDDDSDTDKTVMMQMYLTMTVIQTELMKPLVLQSKPSCSELQI